MPLRPARRRRAVLGRHAARHQFQSAAANFGLDPASRSKVKVNNKTEKVDPMANAQVFAAAAKTDQARTLLNDAVPMVQPSPLLGDRLTPSGVNLGPELGKQPRRNEIGAVCRLNDRDTFKRVRQRIGADGWPE
jgi:hypothetical protein